MTQRQLEELLARNRSLAARNSHLGAPVPATKPKPEPPMTIQQSTDVTKLNKTEQRFHEWLKNAGYPWVGVQNITLKLADDTRYTPDFFVFPDGSGDQLAAYEVKGFWRDDAKVKIKVAARLFPFIYFHVVTWDAKEKAWTIHPVKP